MAGLNKEQRYLKENPEATPYDLLMAGVITQERFNELSEVADKGVQTVDEFKENKPAQKTQSVKDFLDNKPKPQTQSVQEFVASNKLRPTKIVEHRTMPKTSPAPQALGTHSYLTDKITGKTTKMARASAERELRKYPTRYTIS